MRLFFGSLIAVMLLVLYAYTVSKGVAVVGCVVAGTCTAAAFTSGMSSTLSLTNGLVSALVIAELAVTEPGQPPVVRVLGETPSERARFWTKILTGLYLLVWLAAGLWAFVVGFLQHPEALQPVTDLGQAWLGLVIAAGYSYFGVRPSSATGRTAPQG